MGIKNNPIRTNILRAEEPPLEEQIPASPGEKKDKKEKARKAEKSPKAKKEPKPKKEPKVRDFRVLGLFFLLFGAYLLLTYISFMLTWKEDFAFANKSVTDFSFGFLLDPNHPVENVMGKVGAIISYLCIYSGIGVSAFVLVIFFAMAGLKLMLRIGSYSIWRVFQYSLLTILWTPIFLSAIIPDQHVYFGIYGYQTNILLTELIGTPGLILALLFSFLSFLMIVFNIPFRWFIKKELPHNVIETQPVTSLQIEDEESGMEEPKLSPLPMDFEEEMNPDNPLQLLDEELEQVVENPLISQENEKIVLEIEQPLEEIIIPAEKSEELVERFTIDTKYDPTLELSGYKFPPLELLNDYGVESISINNEELSANKNRIVDTLNNYAIKIQKIKATIGPAVTLYEIVPEPGIRISRIKNLENDIALSLAALGIRIIAPIPGKGTIGIEVPNQNPEIVSIKSLLSSEKFQKSSFELPFVLGKTIANETFIADLTKMPHILMAGATGQGKSVGLNTIITSLLYKKHPSLVKFVMIDPKKVELSLFSKIERHYLAKLPDSSEAIITDTKKVIRTLVSLNKEMDDRYDLLQDAQVRNIREYNDKFISRKLNPNDNHRFLPYIIVFVDEFADLIMTAGREIETPITRMAQLARAVGIHLIIATQRPSVNIITGTIKANFPVRIAFKVASKIDSRTILDQSGADQLVGRGDMLLSMGSDLIRLQCAFVDTPEIEKVTDFIGSQRGFPETFLLPEVYDEESEGSKEIDSSERDPLFGDAARLIVQNQQGSTSLIQRKLKLGYNRAGRIIDQLESAGIVGPFEGSKAREVRYSDLNSLEQRLQELGNF